ncbi:MAG: ATP-binding protein [Oscillatoriaceae bacterium SKW80]|nr:ATP-binding protein [Oscillatoriaceae bacterium SKYG93]MCX8120266.1 ATP-binding protein [Oscillatoriaceae bacterium SKW80]MDW8453192.1 ATP-binding protein [Oscillatoriaceae cyanobacterium SKYGB_i_bin93]HIK28896.1 response regulator [Oscillatoriaceae cyanobacterium M7585_C2015_266]
MSTPTLYLKAFIEQVPTCRETTTQAAVLEILQKNQCDRLVVISEEQTPLGLIHLHSLLPHLMTALSTVGTAPRGCLRPSKSVIPELQQPISASASAILEPLASLSANLSLREFWPYLQAQQDILAARQEWALVDETGKFLGLLDRGRLLKFLALQVSPKIAETTDTDETPENLASFDLSEPALLRTFQPLFKILKQLPIPLILQTNKGKVLLRNHAWRREFPQIQVAASTLTEKTQQQENKTAFPHLQQPEPATSQSVCLMPNGQQKVWQFVKMPLGIVLPKPVDKESASIKQQETHSASGSGRKKQQKNSKKAPSPANIQEEPETVWLVLAQDVTEQHLVAKELAAKNADLVQLNRLKDEFLACISHELKTPLTAVLGLSTLLKERAIGPLNERQARYVRLIYQSGRHLMTVVNDILDLTRIETGQMELILEPVNIATVCARAYKQALQHYCALEEEPPTHDGNGNEPADTCTTKVQFSLEIEPGLETLIADELRLRQMLVNLLSNALKFTAAGGKIGLKVNHWEGWIAFTVWDSGIGIPDDKQHLIFQKFSQLENPLTRQFEGAGLGLVLTQRLSRMHGGDVTFISKENQGSQFTLLLPPSPPQSDTLWEGTNKKPHRIVLIVEAVPQFIEALSEQLIDLGYRVLIARTGTEALEKARRFKPQVIFINPVLPLLSGWDVLTLLKADAITSHIPVIVTATQAEKELARQNRADGFLSLPVQPEALQAKLANLEEPPLVRAVSPIVLRLNVSSHKQEENRKKDNINSAQSAELSELMAQFNSLLHRHHYRVLEADDLEEAELLARVWQPNVVLLNSVGGLKAPVSFFKKLSQYSSLASVPLVTLEEEIARAANQVRGLSVFYGFWKPGNKAAPSALLRVLQIATGMNWKPSILVVDISTLPDLSEAKPKNEWLSALIQYIQTAGFKGIVGHSWAEVWRLLQRQSVDLLLICWQDVVLDAKVEQALASLQQLSPKPPIIVLMQQREISQPVGKESENQHSQSLKALHSSSNSPSVSACLEEKQNKSFLGFSFEQATSKTERILLEIATYILPYDLSKADLIDKIRQSLGTRVEL